MTFAADKANILAKIDELRAAVAALSASASPPARRWTCAPRAQAIGKVTVALATAQQSDSLVDDLGNALNDDAGNLLEPR